MRGIAEAKGTSVAQIAIAWVAAKGKDIVPVIGARRRDRLTEALGALSVELSRADMAAIERLIPKDAAAGGRYPEAQLTHLDSEIMRQRLARSPVSRQRASKIRPDCSAYRNPRACRNRSPV